MVVAAFSRVMSTRMIIAILTASLVVVSLAAFGGVISSSPDALGTKPTVSRPLAASRLFMLLPDGKVEVTDAWARRVYRWDGKKWIEVEVSRLAAPEAELR